MGGLVIIADLATRLIEQRAGASPDVGATLEVVDNVLNAIFFSIAGTAVVRETGLIRLAALAGLLAGAIDGAVVGAAVALAPPPDVAPEVTPEALWLSSIVLNSTLGMAIAAASAWFGQLARRRTRT